MVIDKREENSKLFGMSLFFENNTLGLDLFIKLHKVNFSDKLLFYKRVHRVSIIVFYENWEDTLLYFEERDEKGNDPVLIEKISLKNFIKKGNMLMFNPLPTHLTLLGNDRKKVLFEKLSELNNEDFIKKAGIDYQKLLMVYLKDTLRIKNEECVRFECFLD